MTVYEYGKQNDKQVLFIATAALEPYWAFQKQAEALGEDYHVYAVSADGHDGKPGDFISIEKTVSDMTARPLCRLRSVNGRSRYCSFSGNGRYSRGESDHRRRYSPLHLPKVDLQADPCPGLYLHAEYYTKPKVVGVGCSA